nr:LamG domain-containing protein [Gammaproteobacteria bacterium]
YSFKIWESGVLVKNYIPVYNREQNKYGLYDLVSREAVYPEVGELTGERYDYYGQYLEFTGKTENINTYVTEDLELVKYIESNGNQQINTGLIFNPETDSIICDFESTVQNQNGMIIASAQSENYFWFYHYVSGSQITLYNGSANKQVKVGGRAIDLSRHTMSYTNKSFYIDGTLLGTDSRTLNPNDEDLYISSWGNNYFYSGKIYSIKIYRGQYLIRDYVPIYNKVLNKYGLYDRVEEKEYYSDTNSPYTGQRYGTTDDYTMYDMSEVIKKIKEAGLDQVYDLAEYIESTGTQYINTGYVFNSNTSIESEIMFTDQFSYNMMYGAWPLFSVALVDKNLLCVSSGSAETQNVGLNVQANTKYKIVHSPQGIMFNGVAKSFGNGINSNPNDRTLLLFAASDISTGNNPFAWQSYGKGRIYGVKVYEGTELVHFFIPIYNKLTNEYGMFDAFTNTDFYSLGEEKFIGKIASNSYINTQTIVPSYLSLADYIESDGNEYIDTLLLVDENTDIRLDTMFTETTNSYQGVYGFMAVSLRGGTTVSDYTYGDHATHSYENKANTRYVIEWRKSNHGLYIDNNLVYEQETLGKTKDATFYLFAVSNYSTLRSAKARVYSFKAWQNDTIVRYMVPIYNNQSNRYGMYDLVEGKEYYSATDDMFTGKISEESSSNTTINIPGYLNLADHITFTGKQCIDSEIKQLTAYNFVITIDYKRSDIEDADMCLFGQRQFGKFTNIYKGYFESAYGNTTSGTAKDTDRHTVVMDNAGLYLDGKTLITKNLSLVQSDYGALIGAFSETDYREAKWYYKGDIYSIKVLDSGICIKSFIPIYNTLTSDYGLYDLVEGKEYYSISGTKLQGALPTTVDPTIPNYLEEAEYVESTGKQYIDTNWIPSYDKGFTVKVEYTPRELNKRYSLMSNHDAPNATSLEINENNQSRFWIYNGSIDDKCGTVKLEKNTSIFKFESNTFTQTTNGVTSSGTLDVSSDMQASMIIFLDRTQRFDVFTNDLVLYSLKCYDGVQLVRDFIPVYNKLTNSYGLYDKVEGKEYYSATAEGLKGSVSDQIKLPSHLKFAEYIESMGQEYIELPSTLNCDYFEIEAQYKEAETESTLIGNQSNGSSQRWELFTYPQSKTYNIWSASKSTLTSDIDATVKAKISYSYKTGKIRINEKEYNFGVLECQPTHMLQYGNDTLYSKARLYYAKFAKGGETVLYLIPVYNTQTNTYGMYDVIGSREYYSPSSSDFTGSLKDSSNSLLNLPDYIEAADYIKFTGSQTIDSLVTGGATWTFDLKWMPGNDRELMGYGGSSSEYFGIGKDGNYGNYNTSKTKAGNRDLVVFRYDQGESGIWVNGKNVLATSYIEEKTRNSFTFGSLKNNFYATNLTIYDITCVQNNKTIKHFIPIYNKLTNEYGLYDLIEEKEYYSTTDTPLVGARTTKGTLKISTDKEALFVYKGETFKSKCSGVVIYDENGNILSNYAPVMRLSDGKVGFIDLITNEFYLDQNGESFKYDTVSLPIESETVIKEPTYNEEGIKEIKYVGIDEKETVKIDKLSYLVTFTHSNKFAIRIYNTTNIKDGFIDSDSTYSKNQYTFNYSKVNAFVMFEVVSYYGDAYKIGGRAVNIKDNIYIIYNIDSDMDISIIE